MKKRPIAWLIAAIVLVLAGGILFASAMVAIGWDFARFNTAEYETNTHEIREKFENISIETDTADVLFALSEDGKTIVECVKETKLKHSVKAENGTLEIKCTDTRKWYEHIGIKLQTTKITVYLPAGEYAALSVKATTGNTEIAKDFKFDSIDISATTGDIKNAASASGDIRINTTTGDIHMENVSAKNASLSVSTGRITVIGLVCENDFHNKVRTGDTKLSNITCANLFSEGTTGYLALKNVLASEKFSIRRDTGDVTFEDCDAGEIFVKTDTGKISGTLLSEKDFSSCRSDTGSLRVPKNGSGGKCELVTDTGNITIELSRHP